MDHCVDAVERGSRHVTHIGLDELDLINDVSIGPRPR